MENVLRQENFGILSSLLDRKDEDTLKVLFEYQHSRDSEILIHSIMSITEDAL